MKVQYNDFNAVVPDDMDPNAVFNTLKQTFTELQNGSYNVVVENGEKIMKPFVQSGSKA